MYYSTKNQKDFRCVGSGHHEKQIILQNALVTKIYEVIMVCKKK